MALVLLRVDDRLIHGQVATMWTRRLRATRIIVASDEVANDPFLSKVLRLAGPLGAKVHVLTLEQTLGAFETGKLDDDRAIVLVKTPEDALRLIDGGLETDRLNVGGMGSSPGSTRVYEFIYATPPQIKIFQELSNRGIPVEFQFVPDQAAVTLDQLGIT